MLRRWSTSVVACDKFIVATTTTIAGPENCVRHIKSSAMENPAEKDTSGVVFGGGGGSGGDDADSAKYRENLIQAIISRDKEVFELKRQHELSMLRVEQNQRRVLKDQQDRGMYYEQNCNVHTFDTVSVGLYTQRNTLYHTMGVERLRNAKLFLTLLVTLLTCLYFYFRYMINPDWVYVEKPLKMIGSRVGALKDIRAQWNDNSEEGMGSRSKERSY